MSVSEWWIYTSVDEYLSNLGVYDEPVLPWGQWHRYMTVVQYNVIVMARRAYHMRCSPTLPDTSQCFCYPLLVTPGPALWPRSPDKKDVHVV